MALRSSKAKPAARKKDSTPRSFEIEVPRNDALFRELGRNSYDLLDAVSELIDNAIAARISSKATKIVVTFFYSKTKKRNRFSIEDNCCGISRNKLGEAISPGHGSGGGTLNEHGLGMKQAVASIGNLTRLLTKADGETSASEIKKFGWSISGSEVHVQFRHGTVIEIADLHAEPPDGPERRRKFLQYLGARYRRFLLPDSKIAIWVNFESLDDDSKHSNMVEPIQPIYFNTRSRTNREEISEDIIGKNWTAHFTVGFAPEDEAHYAQLGLRKPERSNPYSLSTPNAGFDLIRKDRVIKFHFLEPYLVDTRHGQYNLLRGEIDLISGFHTAITKNAMLTDEAFEECMDKIRNIIEKRGLLSRKFNREKPPESVMRDRLVKILKGPAHQKRSVVIEAPTSVLDGHIDVLADDVPYEIKVDDAAGIDVYQLFGYMDMLDYKTGYLIANRFKPSVAGVVEHIWKKHKKKIILGTFEEFGIDGYMTDEEIKRVR